MNTKLNEKREFHSADAVLITDKKKPVKLTVSNKYACPTHGAEQLTLLQSYSRNTLSSLLGGSCSTMPIVPNVKVWINFAVQR